MGRAFRQEWFGLSVALLAALAGGAIAQAVLRGRVVSDSTKQPVQDAEVADQGSNRSARTDRAGRFSLNDLSGGPLSLRIRAIGFKPLEIETEIGPRDTVELEFRLTPVVQRLPTVEVRAPAERRVSAKMEEFERRERMGFGTFLRRAELVKWQDHPLSVVVRRTAGIWLVARPTGCGGGFAAASMRGGNLRPRCGNDRQLIFPPACYLALFVDGLRVWDPSMDDPPDIDQYLTDRLQALELYRGPGELPVDLQQTATSCGALVLWTRTGEPDPPPPAPPPPPPGRS
jgi:hypothetical protein